MIPEKASEPVRLNLGSNVRPRPGFINVDKHPYGMVDVIADLEKRWPWEDQTVDEIYCCDFPEHLRQWREEPDQLLIKKALEASENENFKQAFQLLVEAIQTPVLHYGIIHFMEECYRCLKHDGILTIEVPTTDGIGRGAFMDPTHVSYWNLQTFAYFLDPFQKKIYYDKIKSVWSIVESPVIKRHEGTVIDYIRAVIKAVHDIEEEEDSRWGKQLIGR